MENLKKGDSLEVRITAVDDQVIGSLNGEVFADIKFGQLPVPEGKAFELKDKLQLGVNVLTFICVNIGAPGTASPWQIGYIVSVKGVERLEWSDNQVTQQGGNGVVYNRTYTFNVTN